MQIKYGAFVIREIGKKDDAGVEALIRTCLLEFGGNRVFDGGCLRAAKDVLSEGGERHRCGPSAA